MKKAEKFLVTIPAKEVFKIMELIENLKENPHPRWVEKLKGIKKGEFYRTFWGKYRVLYSIEDEILLVAVVEIDGRDNCYKKLNKRLK